METENKTTDEVKELCGRCKREKVNGKCPACGRPTKYQGDDIMVVKVEEYLATCVDMPDPLTEKMKVSLPKREGLAIFLDVDMTTIWEWESEYPEFSKALARVDKEQKNKLMDNGLAGTYNPTIAKLILSSNHGMAEKQDVNQKLSGSVSLSNILDAAKETE